MALDMETDVDLPQGHNSLYLSQLSSWPLARQVEVTSFSGARKERTKQATTMNEQVKDFEIIISFRFVSLIRGGYPLNVP